MCQLLKEWPLFQCSLSLFAWWGKKNKKTTAAVYKRMNYDIFKYVTDIYKYKCWLLPKAIGKNSKTNKKRKALFVLVICSTTRPLKWRKTYCLQWQRGLALGLAWKKERWGMPNFVPSPWAQRNTGDLLLGTGPQSAPPDTTLRKHYSQDSHSC